MRKFLFCCLILLLLTACMPIQIPVPVDRTASPAAPTATATKPATAQPDSINSLRIWVTRRFDPAQDSLLQGRLDEFAQKHDGLQIEVRVKEEASLIEALRVTTLAAPSAAPDLIAFSREELEKAVAAGLIQPLDITAGKENWHPLARLMGQVNESTYGQPFALDALALATTKGEELPDWKAIARAGTLVFNVNDASFPLALYLSAGGELIEVDNRVELDEATLTQTLTFFAGGNVIALESDEHVVTVATQGSNPAAGWAGIFLAGEESTLRLGVLPGLDGKSATLTRGWCWSLTTTDPDRRELALELADWLSAEDFLGEWVPTLGLLPPYLDARWTPLLDAALSIPPVKLVEAVSPILREAVRSVLNGTSPEEAAKAALEKLNGD